MHLLAILYKFNSENRFKLCSENKQFYQKYFTTKSKKELYFKDISFKTTKYT